MGGESRDDRRLRLVEREREEHVLGRPFFAVGRRALLVGELQDPGEEVAREDHHAELAREEREATRERHDRRGRVGRDLRSAALLFVVLAHRGLLR